MTARTKIRTKQSFSIGGRQLKYTVIEYPLSHTRRFFRRLLASAARRQTAGSCTRIKMDAHPLPHFFRSGLPRRKNTHTGPPAGDNQCTGGGRQNVCEDASTK